MQRNVLNAAVFALESDKQLIPKADAGDVDAIHAISDYGALSDERKTKYIATVLAHSGGTDFRDRRALAHLWGAYGNLLGAAKGNPDAWSQSVAANGDLASMGPFASAQGQFIVEVRNLGMSILHSNEQEVIRQFERLGADENGNIKGDLGAKDQARLEAQQKAAAQIIAAQDYQKGLRETIVGYAPPLPDSANPGNTKVPVTLGMLLAGTVTPTEPAPEGAPSLEEVKHAYAIAEAIERGLLNQWPALYVAASGGGSSGSPPPGGAPSPLMKLASGTPAEARQTMLTGLKETKKYISEAPPRLADEELPLDLTPLHAQVMSNKGSIFSDPIYKPVVSAIVKGHNEDKAVEMLVLTSVAALAFIVAEFATGGLATFLLATGISLDAITAAQAISHASDLRAVAPTAISDETKMLESGAADAATFEAFLQTVLSVIDLAGAAKAIRGVAGAANDLADVDKLSQVEAAAKLEKSMDEIGVAATVKLSGRTVEELLRLVGSDSRFAAALRLLPGKIEVATGMASARAVAAGARAARILGRDWAKFATVEQRMGWLEWVVNDELAKSGVPAIHMVPNPSTELGKLIFNPHQYELGVPVGWFLNARTAEEVTQLTALAFHEARHAEQWFLVARRMAKKGVSQAEIVAKTGLKDDIVKQALLKPLEDTAPEAAAADRWLASIGTEAGQKLRDSIYHELEKAEEGLAKARKALQDAEAAGDAARIKQAKNDVDDAVVLMEVSEENYRTLPEEIDAYGVSQAIEAQARARRTAAAGAGGGGQP